MIILFEENEKSFSTLGLGVLKDATSCVVKEKLNDEFSLTMEYPVKGGNFSKIKNNRIICVKPNPYTEPQAFRIYSVTKAINGKVIVDANHISYDMNSIPVKAFSAKSMQDVLVQIQNGCVVDNPFVLSSDILRSKTYKTTAPYNLRALIMGSDQSVVTEYDAELEFDNYVVKILAKRGKNRGAVVRYGHNMTDINHVLSTDLLYNGVFPYYHTERTTTETKTSGEFQQVYIVGSKTFQDGWLSYSKNGEPYHPIDESPVQIATEGEYYQKVYAWNTLYNVYQEKIYNEQVTIIQGLTEPSWLTIDWSHFPNIIVKAARKGYYKKATDTDWGEIRGVGDVIYEGSIVSSGLMENLILCFSEVVPANSTSTSEEVSEIVDVQLDQPIIWLETNDAKSMLHDRILMLDLTSEFEEEPSQLNLRAKAEEYINKHKIGTIKHSTTLSFVDLSSTKEGSRFENLDHVELGDTVKIVYEDAGIEVELRVISAEYDVLSGRYSYIELGEKTDKMSDSTIQNGDNVSALTNDVGYATVTTVNKLIANIVTANYIEALNAKLSSAQISQLAVERINCTGIIEASQFAIDSLVAKLLVADDAEIANTLTAGNIKVAGDISVNSGQITITSDNGTSFIVDREGNLTANSVSITGGNLNINDGVFEVTNDGVLTALAADITGAIRAKEGEIAGFIIQEKQLSYGTLGDHIYDSVIVSPGIEAVISTLASEKLKWAFVAKDTFGVTTSGVLYANAATVRGRINAQSGKISGFRIDDDKLTGGKYSRVELTSETYIASKYYTKNSFDEYTLAREEFDPSKTYYEFTQYVVISPTELSYGDGFSVSDEGEVTISKGQLEIQNGVYQEIELTSETYEKNKYYIKTDDNKYVKATDENFDPDLTYYEYKMRTFFIVDSNGNVSANSVNITGGELSISNSSYSSSFNVTQNGVLTAQEAILSGNLNISSGEIILGGSYDISYEEIKFGEGSGTYETVRLTEYEYHMSVSDYDPNVQYYEYDYDNDIYVAVTVAEQDYQTYKYYIRVAGTYESDKYYTKNSEGEYVLATGEFDPEAKYYRLYPNMYLPNMYYTKDGDRYVLSSSFTYDPEKTYYKYAGGANFYVRQDGHVEATDLEIHGGSIRILDPSESETSFEVTNDGTLTAKGAEVHGDIHITSGEIEIKDSNSVTQFKVTNQGALTANNAIIRGSMYVTGGNIEIQNEAYTEAQVTVLTYIPNRFYIKDDNGKYVLDTRLFYTPGETYYRYDSAKPFFSVDSKGNLVANSAEIHGSVYITDGTIVISGTNTSFAVTDQGALTATGVTVTGEINATSGTIGGFEINSGSISSTNFTLSSSGSITLTQGSGNNTSILTIDTSNIGIYMTGSTPSYTYKQKYDSLKIEWANATTPVYIAAHAGTNTSYPSIGGATCSSIELYRSGANSNVWTEGIYLSTYNSANSSYGASSNHADVWVGGYRKNSNGTIIGYPNDLWCESGYVRDKYGPTVSLLKATWSAWVSSPSTDNPPTVTTLLNTDRNSGVSMIAGRFYIASDSMYTWDLSDVFSTIISVTLGYDYMSSPNMWGHVTQDSVFYYQDNGARIYIGNDRDLACYVCCIVIGIPV